MINLGRAILIVWIISLFGCSGVGGGGSERSAISTGTRAICAEPTTVQEALDTTIETDIPGAMVY